VINFNAVVERQLPKASLAPDRDHPGRASVRARNIVLHCLAASTVPDEGNVYQTESTQFGVRASSSVSERFGARFNVFSSYTRGRSDADGANSLPADNYNGSPVGPRIHGRRHFASLAALSIKYGFGFRRLSSRIWDSLQHNYGPRRQPRYSDQRSAGRHQPKRLPPSLYSQVAAPFRDFHNGQLPERSACHWSGFVNLSQASVRRWLRT
jgi:hypothetical protein